MEAMNQYIEIMTDGLQKKSVLLDEIIESNHKMERLVNQPDMDMERFKQLLDEKDECVKQISQLDEGFESLFEKLREELHGNKDAYKQQILSMQKSIRNITDKVVQIQDMESKNKLAIDGQFARKRKNIRTVKKGMDVAQNYYKSMSKLNVVDSQFLDKKN